MSWLRKPGPGSRLAPGAERSRRSVVRPVTLPVPPPPPQPPAPPPAPPPPSGGRSRPGIAEYTPRTVPAPPPPPPAPAQPATAGPPAWCHIHVPHPPHHHTSHGDCPGTLGEPLHPTVLALRRDLQHARDAYAGEHGILLAEPTELTRAQQIRVHALTAARILATARGDLDQQAAAILEVAARFETWIRDAESGTR